MPTFRYTAADDQGKPVAGEVEAGTSHEALSLLAERGLRSPVIETAAESEPVVVGRRLSKSEVVQLTEQLADLTRAELPLSAGLEAAAAEMPNARVAATMRAMASQLASGRPLDDVLADTQRRLPRHVSRLIQAGLKSGSLDRLLTELVEHQYASRELWRGVSSALTYPAILVTLLFVFFVFMATYILPSIHDLIVDFDIVVPLVTKLLSWLCDTGLAILTCLLIGVPLVAGMVRVAVGAARWRRLLSTLPVVGRLSHWSGVAEFSRLLSLLLDENVPLPEALRLTGDGIRDANVGQVCHRLAEAATAGRPLAESMAATRRLPASLEPIVRWGEQAGALPEALRNAGEMFAGRVRLRCSLLKTVLPPVTFIVVGLIIFIALAGLVVPLVSLLQVLS